jgi:hypothetical protein
MVCDTSKFNSLFCATITYSEGDEQEPSQKSGLGERCGTGTRERVGCRGRVVRLPVPLAGAAAEARAALVATGLQERTTPACSTVTGSKVRIAQGKTKLINS